MMKKIEETENQIVFIADISETLANSIRRYTNQVLVMAVDEVEISRNDSPLYDEAVTHRIGLIPLKTEKSVNEKSTGKLKLAVNKEGLVYSGSLKGNLDVVYEKIPITTLSEDQELQLVAFVKAGKGSEHSKFSPGLMFFRNVSEITLDKEFSEEIKKTFPESEIKEKGNKLFYEQKYDSALMCYSEALKSNSKYWDVYVNRANTLNVLKQYQLAINDYNIFLKHSYFNHQAYYWRSIARIGLGDLKGALEDLNRTLKLQPELSQANTLRNQILLEIDKK